MNWRIRNEVCGWHEVAHL